MTYQEIKGCSLNYKYLFTQTLFKIIIRYNPIIILYIFSYYFNEYKIPVYKNGSYII